MSRATPCPTCGLPFNAQWIKIAGGLLGDPTVPSFICPRCTMGRVGLRPVMDLPTAYGVRGLPGEPGISGEEHPDSGTFCLGPEAHLTATRRRLSDVGLALQLAKGAARGAPARASSDPDPRPPRLLHVGSGPGTLVALAGRKFGAEGLGLEPWRAWYDAAVAAGVPTRDLVPELLEPGPTFDVVVEHQILMRVPDPRAHLRQLTRLLAPGGILLLEVPNLLAAPRPLEDGYLALTRPHLFTARALQTLCHRVGLVPLHVVDDPGSPELRVFCRLAEAGAELPRIAPGPRVRDVVAAVQANDLRIKLKRGLALRGPIPALIQMGHTIMERCGLAGARADIAIELARALERQGDWDRAARWLRVSLEHRRDPEVAALAVRCETLARALTCVPGPTTDRSLHPIFGPSSRETAPLTHN